MGEGRRKEAMVIGEKEEDRAEERRVKIELK